MRLSREKNIEKSQLLGVRVCFLSALGDKRREVIRKKAEYYGTLRLVGDGGGSEGFGW